MTEQIYAVYATGVDRDTILAYATGNPKDIEEVYKDMGGYGLKLEQIKIVNITGETGKKIRDLRNAKATCEMHVKSINTELAKLGVKP